MVTARFDLLLDVSKLSESLSYSLTYSTDLFDDPTIAQMTADLTALLERFAAGPGPAAVGRSRRGSRAASLDFGVVATFTGGAHRGRPRPVGRASSLGVRRAQVQARPSSARSIPRSSSIHGASSHQNRDGSQRRSCVRFEDWMGSRGRRAWTTWRSPSTT